MTQLLRKIFIKNKDNITDPKVRKAHGTLSSLVSAVSNLLLALLKLAAGALSGSVSISADGLNNLSDSMSGAVLLVGFGFSGKKADTGHPLGHGRVEYLSGLAVSFLIVLMGFELFKTSLVGIFEDISPEFSWLSFGVLCFSLAVKLWLWAFNRRVARLIDSKALLAGATDSLLDCISTLAVLCGAALAYFAKINLDGYIGCGVAILIVCVGLRSASETISSLLGKAPDREIAEKLESIILSGEIVSKIHDLIIHEYGPGRLYASVHAEVPANMSILEVHDCIDRLEMRIKSELNVDITIHPDPDHGKDQEYNMIFDLVQTVLRGINTQYLCHDLHVTHPDAENPSLIKVVFDVVVPSGDMKHSKDIANEIKERLCAENCNIVPLIKIETKYM